MIHPEVERAIKAGKNPLPVLIKFPVGVKALDLGITITYESKTTPWVSAKITEADLNRLKGVVGIEVWPDREFRIPEVKDGKVAAY